MNHCIVLPAIGIPYRRKAFAAYKNDQFLQENMQQFYVIKPEVQEDIRYSLKSKTHVILRKFV